MSAPSALPPWPAKVTQRKRTIAPRYGTETAARHCLVDLRAHAREPESPRFTQAIDILGAYEEYRQAGEDIVIALNCAIERWQEEHPGQVL